MSNIPETQFPYLIKFWHGQPEDKTHFMNKVNKVCRKDDQGNWWWDGSLEDFAVNWGEKFVYYPTVSADHPRHKGFIGITPYSGFGSR